MMNTKQDILEIEEIQVAQNTLTDEWLSKPRNQKQNHVLGTNDNTVLPTLITPALNHIKRVSANSSNRSILRKTIVTFTQKRNQLLSPSTNNITFLVPNVIKERQLFASQILSLDDDRSSSRLSRWILDDRKIKIDNDQSHLELLKKLNESKKNQHIIHNPSTKHSQDNVAYISMISVLNLIGGGLLCSSETGDDDFFIVPTGPSNAIIVQIRRNINSNSHASASRHDSLKHVAIDTTKINKERDYHHDNDDECIKEPNQKKHKVNISNGDTSETEDLRLDKRVLFKQSDCDELDWNHLNEKYDQCLTSETVSPVTFVQEMIANVIQNEWSHTMDSTEYVQNSTKCIKSSCLESIMRKLRMESKILLTKTEISHSISAGVSLTHKERLIIVQALLRIQLFSLHSDNDDLTAKFLKEYTKQMIVSNPQSKKKKSSKLTTEQYVNDICGIVQMLAFSSPTPDSFASAVAENILQPFATSASSLVFDIANYFEVDLLEHENNNASEVEIIHAKKPNQPPHAIEKSRWDDVPDSEIVKSPEMMLTPKVEPTDTHENDVAMLNKVQIAVKNTKNHLLFTKERYCGRMFNTNHIRQVTVSKTNQQLKKTSIKKEDKVKQEDEDYKCEVMATPDSRGTFATNRRLSSSNPLLGRRLIMPAKERIEKSTLKQGDRGKDPHAKFMKAVVAMRKRR